MKRGRWTAVLEKSLENKGKVHDVSDESNIINSPTGGAVVYLANPISRGTGYTERIGNIVRLKTLQFQLCFIPSGHVQPDLDRVRVAIVFDRQPTGVLPTYQDIFKGAFVVSIVNDSFCHPNVDNEHRFIIIKDYLYQLPQAVTPITSTNRCVLGSLSLGGKKTNIIQDFIDLSGLSTVFNGTAVPLTIAQITTGALYVVLQGRYTSGSNAWSAKVHLRLRYDE